MDVYNIMSFSNLGNQSWVKSGVIVEIQLSQSRIIRLQNIIQSRQGCAVHNIIREDIREECAVQRVECL